MLASTCAPGTQFLPGIYAHQPQVRGESPDCGKSQACAGVRGRAGQRGGRSAGIEQRPAAGGKATLAFSTESERTAFCKTAEYKRLLALMDRLPAPPIKEIVEYTASANDAIKRCLPWSVHAALLAEAKAEGVSLNQLCLSKLVAQLRAVVYGTPAPRHGRPLTLAGRHAIVVLVDAWTFPVSSQGAIDETSSFSRGPLRDRPAYGSARRSRARQRPRSRAEAISRSRSSRTWPTTTARTPIPSGTNWTSTCPGVKRASRAGLRPRRRLEQGGSQIVREAGLPVRQERHRRRLRRLSSDAAGPAPRACSGRRPSGRLGQAEHRRARRRVRATVPHRPLRGRPPRRLAGHGRELSQGREIVARRHQGRDPDQWRLHDPAGLCRNRVRQGRGSSPGRRR